MASRRPFYRQNMPPRGYRGPSNGNGDFGHYSIPAPPVRLIYDLTIEKGSSSGSKNNTDSTYNTEILERASNLTPSAETRKLVNEYARKVIVALEKEKTERSLSNVGIARIVHVGSFVTDTTTHSSDRSDVVVQMNTLPSFETVSELGWKVVENMKLADPKETGTPVQQPYGCLITTHNCHVRILITIIPEDAEKLEPELHLETNLLKINYFAILHTEWFLSQKQALPAEFIQEYQALVRVLKDTRARFSDFKHISIWALQYLAYFCLFNGPNRQKVCLGTAFRRFFETIAAGIFLPNAPRFIDPTSPIFRIGDELKPPQMDAICMGAQTLVRIFATGSDGYRAILGTQGTAADLTQTASSWKGIEIRPSTDAYKEDCMNRESKEDKNPL